MKTVLIIGSLLAFFMSPLRLTAQAADALVRQVKAKMDQVKNYQADGVMKTNISFLKVPQANVKVYFKQPGKVKIVNEQGISLVPKGAINFSLNNVLATDGYTVLDAGTDKVNGTSVRVVKLIPTADNSEVVLSTLYIDPTKLVVLRAKTTTRDNGTYELALRYGSYLAYALPDQVLFTFNTKEYKLPKGLTFDYDDGTQKKKPATVEDLRGEVVITYKKFIINKGVDDSVFK
jgi:outer membrane lipoprotein-sorting protein